MISGRYLAAAVCILASGVVVAADLDAEADFAFVESISDLTEARSAVKALQSEVSLELVARSSQSWRLRADAVYFLQSECVRQEIFAADPDWRVKSSAVYHTVDGEFLKRVACDETIDARVRMVAVSRLRDRDLLEAIAANPSNRVGPMARRQLPPAFVESSFVDIGEVTVTEDAVTYRCESALPGQEAVD